jgi:hypothetical protein
LALEPRIIFDAAAATTVGAAADNHGSAATGASLAAISAAEAPVTPSAAPDTAVHDSAAPVPAQTTSASAAADPGKSESPSTDASVTSAAPDSGTIHEIVIVDSAVPDIADLLSAVKPGDKVFVLDASKDGVQQIADIIRDNNLHDLSAIQIIGHGASGDVQLGSTILSLTRRCGWPCVVPGFVVFAGIVTDQSAGVDRCGAVRRFGIAELAEDRHSHRAAAGRQGCQRAIADLRRRHHDGIGSRRKQDQRHRDGSRCCGIRLVSRPSTALWPNIRRRAMTVPKRTRSGDSCWARRFE